MKKVSFFLDNSTISVDCTNILQGNPGIGGTECMVITVATLLSQRNNDINIKLYILKEGKFPFGLQTQLVPSFKQALKQAEIDNYDYFIFKHDVNHIFDKSLETINSKLRLIPWCHVFVCYWELDYYSNNPFISNIITVGREMNDLYRDHAAFLKSTYIYNCVNIPDEYDVLPYNQRKNIVTYIGCLKPFKGLHFLAKAWPKVLKEVPDAELYIIGSGKLYDSNTQMGKLGIAEENYENVLLKYLSVGGKVLPSVHFMGVLGQKKYDILKRTKVGVPNPSGITETFGISAVEMQLMGARVVTMKCPGHIDTIKNGILYNDVDLLAHFIVKSLRETNSDYEIALEFFKKNFSYNVVAERWEELILKGQLQSDQKIVNLRYRLKFLKEFFRFIKTVIPFLYKLPPLERIILFVEKQILHKSFRYIDSNIKCDL